MRVFHGALDSSRLHLVDRLARRLPAGRRLLPAGNFRDWNAIDLTGPCPALVVQLFGDRDFTDE